MLSTYDINTSALISHLQSSTVSGLISSTTAAALVNGLPDFLIKQAHNDFFVAAWTSEINGHNGFNWAQAQAVLYLYGANSRALAGSELQRPLEIWLGTTWDYPWSQVNAIAEALWEIWAAGNNELWGTQPEIIAKAYSSFKENKNKDIVRRLV